MASTRQDREESISLQRENQSVSMRRQGDRMRTPSMVVESYHSDREVGSPSYTENRVSRDKEVRKMQLEINHLRRKLKRKRSDRRISPSFSSDDSEVNKGWDDRHMSKSPPSESRSIATALDKSRKQGQMRRGLVLSRHRE